MMSLRVLPLAMLLACVSRGACVHTLACAGGECPEELMEAGEHVPRVYCVRGACSPEEPGLEDKRARLPPAPVDYDSLLPVSGSGKTYALLDNPMASSRSFNNMHAPLCACEAQQQSMLIDLGPLRFPRYHSSLVCSAEPCWLEPYSCRNRTLKVWVLKLREPRDMADRHAPLLPEALRGLYVFEGLMLTVGCSCSP